MTQREVVTLKAGIWLYDGLVPMSVHILVQNWDCYWEEGYDLDPSDLNEAGRPIMSSTMNAPALAPVTPWRKRARWRKKP